MKHVLKSVVKHGLARCGYQIRPLDSAKLRRVEPWDADGAFAAIFEQAKDHTVVGKARCFFLYQAARHCSNLPGDVAEVGVYRGGTGRLLAETFASTGKAVHLFDTFCGMPPTDPERDPYYRQGAFGSTSLEAVAAYLQDCAAVRLYRGIFPQTAGPIAQHAFCLVHVDVDIYSSVIDCCRFFYPRLSQGGMIIFDDYGDATCPGARQAVDEFFAGKPENPCYLATGQCFVTRL